MIDDHPVNRIVTATPLEQVGAAVDTAPSAMEGLKLIETHAYDLLLIDLHMPEMDGVQATNCCAAMKPKVVAHTKTGYRSSP